jgi:hypothetical protein
MLACPATDAQATFEPDDEDAPDDPEDPADPDEPEDDDESEDDAAAAGLPAFLSPGDDPPSLAESDELDESGPDEDEPGSDPFSALSFAVFSFVAVALALARESVR